MSAPVKILALAVAALMSGCSMIPTYVRPEIGVPGQWPTAVSTPSAPVVAMQDWASYFPDPRLQGLIKAAQQQPRFAGGHAQHRADPRAVSDPAR